MSIASDTAVVKNCGCTDLTPKASHIAAGASSLVAVAVHTASRSGPIRYGGQVTWTTPGGAKRVTAFALRATVTPVLSAIPPALSFGPGREDAEAVKELTVTAALPLEPETVRFESSADVRVTASRGESGAWRCRVRCLPANGLASVVGGVTVSGRVADGSSALAGTDVTLNIPVLAKWEEVFAVQPRTAPVAFGDDGYGVARLLLRGTDLAGGPRAVKSVTCEGCRVEWTMSDPTAANTSVLVAKLEPLVSDGRPLAPLLIEVAGMESTRVPTVAVRPPTTLR